MNVKNVKESCTWRNNSITAKHTCQINQRKMSLHFIDLNPCFTEPPPIFVWTHPVHGDITKNSENYMVLYEEYQGGATTTLVINHAGV